MSIPGDRPGYYKWWAEKTDLDILLDGLNLSSQDLLQFIERKQNLYCIYVGIAVNESIRSRLDWHVNDPQTESRVKNGTLSTLRQSISSAVCHNQYDKKGTDDFIDRLFVEYFDVDSRIKSTEAKDIIIAIESKMMSDNLCILNIQGNRHPASIEVKSKLKQVRKESKQMTKRPLR